jgi:hypothetical protein
MIKNPQHPAIRVRTEAFMEIDTRRKVVRGAILLCRLLANIHEFLSSSCGFVDALLASAKSSEVLGHRSTLVGIAIANP